MNRIPCPDKHTLERLALGEALPEELGPLAEHLERCPHCTETLVGLTPEDTLTSAVRAQKAAAIPPPEEAVEALIGRLAGMQASVGQGEATAVQGSPSDGGAGGTAYPFLGPPQEPGEIGRLGSYRVLKALGAGGMGVVFQAEDLQLRRPVALKVMKPALAANEADRRRFLREARAAAAVAHDHIVTIFQVGEDRGTPFLTMQFLEGETLEDRLKREGRLPLAEVVRVGQELAEGLAVAHEHGLIHRDVKPANVWLEAPRGRVRILDFGLARPRGDEAHLTQSGAIVGTPAYMAPEQARGEEVDARADLFSLGCVLYRMATGELPFKGKDTLSQLHALATQRPKPPRELNPTIPRPLNGLILRLLEKEPARRPQSAGEVIRALEHTQPAKSAPGGAKRRPWIRAAVAAGFLAAAVLATVIIIRDKSGKKIAEVPVPPGGKAEFIDDGKKDVPAVPAVPTSENESVRRGAARPDREKPFVLVHKDGRREAFKRFSAAFAVLEDGDAVEVFGDGPFTLPPIHLDGKGLTVRAGPGYRPRFVPPAGDITKPWIMVNHAPLRLEGCDFHRPAGDILGGSGSWEIEGCRLIDALDAPDPLVVFDGPKLVVRDCLVAARYGFSCGPGVQVELTNNLSHTVDWVVGLSDGTVRLNGNTILSERSAVGLGLQAGTKPVTIRAEGNLFRAGYVAATPVGAPPGRLHWEGRDDLYSLTRSFLSWDQGVKNLDGWAKFCGRPERGSRTVPDVWFTWDEAAWDGPDKGLPALRRLTESVKQRYGLAELGPRWDLVGPGDAYVRALAASGDPRAKDPLRPAPPEGGPVVLLRGGKVLHGCKSLQQAFDAAAGGDVIELRTDGPLAGAMIGHGRDLALAVRAAPGYRPVVEGDLAFLGPARVTLEGLHFHKGAVLNRSHLGRLVRLANCSFDVRDTQEIVSMWANEGASRPTEIVNCWLPGIVTLASDVNQKVLVRDSVIGRWSQQGGKSLRVAWERCLLWNPGQGRVNPSQDYAVAVLHHPQLHLDLSARASLIESGLIDVGWDNFTWSGTDDVYRTDNDGLLGQLRQHGSAEEGSLTDAPLEWDPAQWRLLPGQPKRAAGGDYGADVSRILTAPRR